MKLLCKWKYLKLKTNSKVYFLEKKFIFFLLAIIVLLINSCASENKDSESIGGSMYLLKIDNESDSIFPNVHKIPIKIWPKIIYKLNGQSLIPLDTMNSEEGYYLRDFVQFPDHNLIYFVEEEYKNFEQTRKFNISFFDYDNDSLIIRRIKSTNTSLFKNFSYDPFSFVRNNDIYICNQWEFDLQHDKIRRFAFDRDFNLSEVNYKDAHNIYAFGASGYHEQLFFSYKYPFNGFPKLKIKWESDYEKMPDARFQLPRNLIDYSNPKLFVEANNENYIIGVLGKGARNYIYGTDRLLIYKKKTRSWDTLTLKGEEPIGRIWKNWIYGTKIWRDYKTIDDEKTEKTLKKLYHNGVMDDSWFRDNTLFLYHIPGKKMIEWKPKNGDSEIIQIIDGIIYYRVFDELRKVRLDEKILNIDWSTDELIVKNKDIIPYVHHIFFSNTTQTKCEEVWVNKPEKCK